MSFSNDSFKAVEMIGHLKVAFNSLVEKSQWMDSETKIRALEKAAAMKEFVAYPDWILNKTQLTQAYDGVCFYNFISFFFYKKKQTRTSSGIFRFIIQFQVETTNKSHFDNYLNVTRFLEYGEMKGLRLPTDRTT
jgi:hypothetical protein